MSEQTPRRASGGGSTGRSAARKVPTDQKKPADQKKPTKGERTRATILDAATELFSRSGFHAVSLRDIAAHAGLTHAGLLHHFPGKEDVLIKVLGRRDRADAALLWAPDADERPEALLDATVRIVHRNMATPGMVGLYVKISGEAADPGHPAHAYFVQRYRVLREALTKAFSELFARHDPALHHDAGIVAGQFLALMDGLQTQWLLEPEAVDMHASVVAFLRQLGLTLELSPEPAPPTPATSETPQTSGTSSPPPVKEPHDTDRP
ncbi:TetR/AcrR family transcriptional regulator [Actinomadura algeriensis]|uniref:AcrR family transcriptional regulator n=1 Tax=Actinomadura algeriensis TaxID=1679523 RepID=A0ABR9JKY2_9ACTN|nr:TetR/AcrR family transcriptional regulator [Actinomadura algeriensis]MBE1531212.1 AcrR family transcriptional regulator [Actinomadura algeriensis]